MGFLGGASAIVKTASSVAGTVVSLGKTAVSAGKTIFSSKLGKAGIVAGLFAALSRNSVGSSKGGIVEGAKNLFGTVFDKIKSVGANVLGKITGKTLDVGNTLRESVSEMQDAADNQKAVSNNALAEMTQPTQTVAETNDVSMDCPSM